MEKVNIDEILDRLSVILHARNDSHLSIILGRKSNQVYQWRDRKTMDWELVIGRCIEEKCSIDWVITGEGSRENSNERLLINQAKWFHENIESVLRGDKKWNS